MWRRSIFVFGVLVLAQVGVAVSVAAKVQVGVEVEPSTQVELGEPFSLRLVPLDCDGCPVAADITNLAVRVVTGEGIVVWEGGVSALLTLDGVVLGEEDVQVGSTTWLSVMVPVDSVLGLLPDVDASSELPEFVSVGRIAVLGSPAEGNTTTLMVVVVVILVTVFAGLLARRVGRSQQQSEGASEDLAGAG